MGATGRVSRRSRLVVAVGAVVVVVVGVVVWRVATAPDLSPVPQVAQGPYLCGGVPQEGAELILGGTVEATRDEGEWGSDDDSFRCTIERGEGAIDVLEEPISSGPISDPQMFLEHYRSSTAAEEFSADAQGYGFASVDGPAVADWLCGDRYLRVVISRGVHGRDTKADAIAYLSSMLPWGCGDTDPPEADPQPRASGTAEGLVDT